MPNNKKFTFTEAINDALHISMKKDKKMICYGLGVTDPKSVFSTTKNLKKKFGHNRVFDVPTSENALTGISIGAGVVDRDYRGEVKVVLFNSDVTRDLNIPKGEKVA